MLFLFYFFKKNLYRKQEKETLDYFLFLHYVALFFLSNKSHIFIIAQDVRMKLQKQYPSQCINTLE